MMGFTAMPSVPLPIESCRWLTLFFYRALRAGFTILGGLVLFPLVMVSLCLLMCGAVAHDWLEQQIES